jgi:hypothetical protein
VRAQVLSRVTPRYQYSLKHNGITGLATVQCTTTEGGNTGDITVIA